MEIKRNPAAAPFKARPAQTAPQPLDDLAIQWLRQMRQPMPTVQAALPPVEPQVDSEPTVRRPQPPERRWFTAQNSPAKVSPGLKPLPVRRRKKSASSWAQWSGLLPLMLPQAMRRMRQALWRETQRVSRLTMVRWRQHQHRRREGRRRA